MSEAKKQDSFMTPKGRVSFANVFKPVKNDHGEETYRIALIFDEEAQKDPNFKRMKVLAKKTFIAKFGQDAWDKAKKNSNGMPKGYKDPFRDGDEKSEYEGFEGNIYVNLSSKFPPGLVDAKLKKIISEDDFYSGCYAWATITCYAFNKEGNKGVAFGLNNIQKLADGEKLGGGAPKAEDEFQAVEADDFDDTDFDETSIN